MILARIRSWFTNLQRPQIKWPLIGYLALTLILFGGFAHPSFTTDTYADLGLPAKDILSNFLQSGRFVTALFFCIFRGLHVNINIVYIINYVAAVALLVLALFFTYRFVQRYLVKNHCWAFILSAILLLNPFLVELFIYIETSIMILGILSCVLAATYFARYCESNQKINLLWACLCSIFATFCYQGIIGLLIVLMILYTVMRAENWRKFIRLTLISVVIYALGPLLNLLLAKTIHSGGRIGGEIILARSFEKILNGAGSMFGLFRLMPSWVFWGLIILVLLIWLGKRLYARELFRCSTLLVLAEIIYCSGVVVLAALAPQIVQATASIWVVSRSTYIFASLAGVILAIILHHDTELYRYKLSNISLMLLVLGYFMVEFFSFARIEADHQSLATLDRLRAERINTAIIAYENSQNMSIAHLMVANDQYSTYGYPGLFITGDLNVSAFNTSWSDVTSINYWNNRNFDRIEADAKWQDFCSQHNWQHSDGDYIEFVGDTAKICWF